MMIKNSFLHPGVFVQLQVIDFISVSILKSSANTLKFKYMHILYIYKKKWRGKLDIHFKRITTNVYFSNFQCLYTEVNTVTNSKENEDSFKKYSYQATYSTFCGKICVIWRLYRGMIIHVICIIKAISIQIMTSLKV